MCSEEQISKFFNLITVYNIKKFYSEENLRTVLTEKRDNVPLTDVQFSDNFLSFLLCIILLSLDVLEAQYFIQKCLKIDTVGHLFIHVVVFPPSLE